MAYLGIDIGTQSLKATVTDDGLRLLGSSSAPYLPDFPRPGWAEQDPGLWLRALRPAIAAALEAAHLSPRDVTSLAVCGQLDGCIGVDAEGSPLGPAIIWMDRRAPIENVDAKLVRDRAGLVLDATHMAAKIGWWRSNIGDAELWHQPVTYVLETLTGRRIIDRGLASTTMLYGLAAGDWDTELLAAFAIDPAKLPALAEASDTAGELTSRGAALTGLLAGTRVAVGTGDDFSNPLGCGIARPGTASVTLGTAEAVSALSDRPTVDDQMLVETHAFPGGLFHIGNPGWLSGGAVTWLAKMLRLDGAGEVSRLAALAPPGCDGLTFLPALSGAMTPRWIASARGAFYGLTAAHDQTHMARAVLEGTAFAMRDVIDRLEEMDVPATRLRIVGGGAQSEIWTRIHADLAGLPAEAMAQEDASARGAALLAAVAAGGWPDCPSASLALDLPLRTIEPDNALRPAYDDAHARYRQLFAALEPMY